MAPGVGAATPSLLFDAGGGDAEAERGAPAALVGDGDDRSIEASGGVGRGAGEVQSDVSGLFSGPAGTVMA